MQNAPQHHRITLVGEMFGRWAILDGNRVRVTFADEDSGTATPRPMLAYLTPSEARELAASLVAAADDAE